MRKRISVGAVAMATTLAAGLLVTAGSSSALVITGIVRVNAGGPAYTDPIGKVWEADKYFVGGETHSTTRPIAGTTYDELYQSERWGMSAYRVPVPNGKQKVRLLFAEINPGSGTRVMSVEAEDDPVITDMNISEEVGNHTRLIKSFSTQVSDGVLDLGFSHKSNDPKIAGIEVITLGTGSKTTSTTVRPSPSTTARPTSTTARPNRPTTTVRPTATTLRRPTTTTSAPAGSGGASPSGQAMPVGDLPGWRQIFTEDFTTNVPVGSFPGSAYGSKWGVYGDGTPDTAGQNENGRGRYYPSRVVSVNNGILNKDLHTENGIAMVAALLPKFPGAASGKGQTYGRYSVRFRADSVPGYKMAWLQWPDSENWSDGEIDFPEGDLDGRIAGFNHCIGDPARNCLASSTQATFPSWHTATIEWSPGRLVFILDGAIIGTTTSSVPDKPMHWVLQTETCLGGCQPSASARGNVQIDWVTAWARA